MGKGKWGSWDYAFRTGMFNEEQDRVLKNYGIDERKYKDKSRGRPGLYEDENGGYAGMRRDLIKAANNDYDTRRMMEAAALTGDEDAKKYSKSGYKTVEDVGNAHKWIADNAKKHLGINKLDSTQEFAQLTSHYVNKDRDQMASKKFLDDKLNALKEQQKPKEVAEENTEYVESDALSSAKKRLAGEGDSGNKSNDSMFKTAAPTEKPTTAFAKANESVPSSDDQGTAVASYLEQYKKDLAKGAGLKEDKEANISNALSAVAGM